MKLRDLLQLAIAFYFCYLSYQYVHGHAAPAIHDSHGPAAATIYDFDGTPHPFAVPRKPLLLAIWVDGCDYDQNKLAILDEMRGRYPADKLDIVGAYIGGMSETDVKAYVERAGLHGLALASGQQTLQQNTPLFQWLETLRDPGKDAFIYLIKSDGSGRAFRVVNGAVMVPRQDVERDVSAEFDKPRS